MVAGHYMLDEEVPELERISQNIKTIQITYKCLHFVSIMLRISSYVSPSSLRGYVGDAMVALKNHEILVLDYGLFLTV